MRIAIILIACLSLWPAKAEFLMLSATDTSDPTARAQASHPSVTPKPGHRRHIAASPEPTLTGFGDQVPLTFAVRQIVPARYHVVFGETVDAEAAVDWKGGKPWRATLIDTLKPLGFMLSITGSTVTIAAPAPAR